jgi:hypothetical protein
VPPFAPPKTVPPPWLYCTSIQRTEPQGASLGVDSNSAAIYPCVRFTCQFNLLPYFIRPDSDIISTTAPLAGYPDEGNALAEGWFGYSRYVSRSVKPGGVMYTLPLGVLKRTDLGATDAGNKIPQGIPFHSIQAQVRYTHHQVPIDGIPFKAIKKSFNGVNDADFDFAVKGTLLLKDLEVTQYPNYFGQWLADVTYLMSWQPNYDPVSQTDMGWNSRLLYDKPSGKFRYVAVSTNGLAPTDNNAAYPFRDFTALFRPDQLT